MEKSEKQLISELKSKVGNSAIEVIIGAYGLEKKGTNYKCIDRSKHKNNDKNPSMSWDYKLNQFYCFKCGKIIDIYNYYTEIEGKTFKDVMTEYGLIDNQINLEESQTNINNQDNKLNKISDELKELSQEALKYINIRKINQDTLNNFNIKTYNNKIAFVYTKYNFIIKKEEIIGVKLRTIGKCEKHLRFGAVAGSGNKNFWNQSNVKLDNDTLIISEGEFDAMCIYQCGYQNVVSIPDGVKSSKRVIQQEKEWLDKFQNIIVVSDNDEAGSDMDKTFIDLLGNKVRLIDKSLMKENDINAEYYKYGLDKIKLLIDSAQIKIEGFRDVTNNPYKYVTKTGIKFIPTGIDSLDNIINDLESRRLTTIFGRAGEGKTTFIEQIQNQAIDKGYKVLRVDGEHDQEFILNNSYRKIIGNNKEYYDLIKFNKMYKVEPKQFTLKALQEWHKNKLYLYTKGDANLSSTEELFEKVKYIIDTKKVDLVILDNLMSLLDVSKDEKNNSQSEFMKKCHNLVVSHNVHLILVTHSNKSLTKDCLITDYYQISGTADIANLSDTICLISMEHDEEKKKENIDGHITLMKNRGYGKLIKIDTSFNENTNALEEIDKTEVAGYKNVLGWEKYIDQNEMERYSIKNENKCNNIQTTFDEVPF
jgi:twinkle protein